MNNDFIQQELDLFFEEARQKQLEEDIQRRQEEDDRRLAELAEELEQQREQDRKDEDERIARLKQEIEEDRELRERLDQEQVERDELEQKRLESERIENEERDHQQREEEQNRADIKAQEERSEQERLKTELRLEQERNSNYSARDFAAGAKGFKSFKQFTDNSSALRFARRPRWQRLQESRGKQLEWHVRYQNSVQRQELQDWRDHDPENHEAYFQERIKQLNAEMNAQLETEVEHFDLDKFLEEYDAEVASSAQYADEEILDMAERELSDDILKAEWTSPLDFEKTKATLEMDAPAASEAFIESSAIPENLSRNGWQKQLEDIVPDMVPKNVNVDSEAQSEAHDKIQAFTQPWEDAHNRVTRYAQNTVAQHEILGNEKAELDKYLDSLNGSFLEMIAHDRLEELQEEPELLDDIIDRLPADYEHSFDSSEERDVHLVLDKIDDFAVSIQTAEEAKFRNKISFGEAVRERDQAVNNLRDFVKEELDASTNDSYTNVFKQECRNAINDLHERHQFNDAEVKLEEITNLERDEYESRLDDEEFQKPELTVIVNEPQSESEVKLKNWHMVAAYAAADRFVANYKDQFDQILDLLEKSRNMQFEANALCKSRDSMFSKYVSTLEDPFLKKAALKKMEVLRLENAPKLKQPIMSDTEFEDRLKHGPIPQSSQQAMGRIDDLSEKCHHTKFMRSLSEFYSESAMRSLNSVQSSMESIVEGRLETGDDDNLGIKANRLLEYVDKRLDNQKARFDLRSNDNIVQVDFNRSLEESLATRENELFEKLKDQESPAWHNSNLKALSMSQKYRDHVVDFLDQRTSGQNIESMANIELEEHKSKISEFVAAQENPILKLRAESRATALGIDLKGDQQNESMISPEEYRDGIVALSDGNQARLFNETLGHLTSDFLQAETQKRSGHSISLNSDEMISQAYWKLDEIIENNKDNEMLFDALLEQRESIMEQAHPDWRSLKDEERLTLLAQPAENLNRFEGQTIKADVEQAFEFYGSNIEHAQFAVDGFSLESARHEELISQDQERLTTLVESISDKELKDKALERIVQIDSDPALRQELLLSQTERQNSSFDYENDIHDDALVMSKIDEIKANSLISADIKLGADLRVQSASHLRDELIEHLGNFIEESRDYKQLYDALDERKVEFTRHIEERTGLAIDWQALSDRDFDDDKRAAPSKEDRIVKDAALRFSNGIYKGSPLTNARLDKPGEQFSALNYSEQDNFSFDASSLERQIDALKSNYQSMSYSDPRVDQYTDMRAYLTLDEPMMELKEAMKASIRADLQKAHEEKVYPELKQDYASFLRSLSDPSLHQAAQERMEALNKDPALLLNASDDRLDVHANETNPELQAVLRTVDEYAFDINKSQEKLSSMAQFAEKSENMRNEADDKIREIFEEHSRDEVFSIALRERYTQMLAEVEREIEKYPGPWLDNSKAERPYELFSQERNSLNALLREDDLGIKSSSTELEYSLGDGLNTEGGNYNEGGSSIERDESQEEYFGASTEQSLSTTESITREEEAYRLVDNAITFDTIDTVTESAEFNASETMEAGVLDSADALVPSEQIELAQDMRGMEVSEKEAYSHSLDILAEEQWQEHWLEENRPDGLELEMDDEDGVLDLFGLDQDEKMRTVENNLETEKSNSMNVETNSKDRDEDDGYER